jgi:isopenicillin-N epimerase
MRAVELPPCDPAELWARLFSEHRVEAPAYEFGGRPFLRASIGPYNDEDDVDRLVAALRALLGL